MKHIRDDTGGTVLDTAATKGRLTVVSYLLSDKISPAVHQGKKLSDFMGALPNHGGIHSHASCRRLWPICPALSCFYGAIRVLKFILSDVIFPAQQHNRLAAFINQKDSDGETAFHAAVRNAKMNVFLPLVNQGATLEAKNNDGWTALHMAVANEKLATASWLLQRNLAVDAVTNAGNTPLHLVAKRNWYQGAMALLNARADHKVRNRLQLQPIHVADILGSEAVTGALFSAGVQLTPLYPDYNWDIINERSFE
ncbi:ankyrin repeat-containing domain protein [Xylariomycetidae sp. FL0641]|nr:ankyrin repeat-containing domain protein [Xylariomycetidae sp. FL0641]